jgi:hypothetical protein
MQVWLKHHLITLEGTPEEWARFLERLFYAQNYPGDSLMRQFFAGAAKQYPPKQENATKRNWMPDLDFCAESSVVGLYRRWSYDDSFRFLVRKGEYAPRRAGLFGE